MTAVALPRTIHLPAMRAGDGPDRSDVGYLTYLRTRPTRTRIRPNASHRDREVVMLDKCLRIGALAAALVASIHVHAETRYWTLSGVQFEDGAVATGYFSYDDATRALATWNVRMSGGAGPFIPATFVPGNSIATGPFGVYSYSPGLPGAECCWWRDLDLTPAAPLDGRSATVPIAMCRDCRPNARPLPDESFSRETFLSYYDVGPVRKVVAGSFVLTPAEPPLTIVRVEEFHHRGLGHYFITADAAEKQLLDTGVHPGWERTGESFKAYAAGSPAAGSIGPVCRYYGKPDRGLDSHFYSAYGRADDPPECVAVFVKFRSDWMLESDNVFQVDTPDAKTGACPSATVPVYRLWNQRRDSNHRYTTSVVIKAQMIASGYVAEGYGPDGVVMCAVQ
jgi:hypothetical protein